MITLPPFKAFLASNIPSVYDNTLSYYDELVKLIGYLEQVVVPVVNETAGEVDAIKKGLEELKSYVDNYFENLDVQEEINNKLDEMAEGGQLASIIAQFLEVAPLFVYDTVADMVDAENLIAGCRCQTLGKTTLNDGLGAYYKIDTTGDIALDNGLYATVVDDFGGNNYYDEITVAHARAYDTDYCIATIPLNDTDGNLIGVYVNDETNNPVHTPSQYAQSAFTTLTLNAGLGRQDSHDIWCQGAVIANGVITNYDTCDIPAPETWSYIGFKEDRQILDFPSDTTPEAMLAQGVKNAFLTFGKVIKNGAIDLTNFTADEENPWTLFGTKNDGTIIILTSDGRTEHDTNMTLAEAVGLMLTNGCVEAWKFDGGGSNALVWKGSKQNRNIDEHGTKERKIWTTLNVKKQTIDTELAKVNSFIGQERHLLNKQIRDDVESTYGKKRATLYYYNINLGYNTPTTGTEMKVVSRFALTTENKPYVGADGRVFSLIIDENNRYEGFKLNKTGLFKITITANIYCTNTAGERAFRIDSPFGTVATAQLVDLKNYIVPTANNEFHETTGSLIINNTTAGKEYYIGAWGITGDDFNRIAIVVEELGNPD